MTSSADSSQSPYGPRPGPYGDRDEPGSGQSPWGEQRFSDGKPKPPVTVRIILGLTYFSAFTLLGLAALVLTGRIDVVSNTAAFVLIAVGMMQAGAGLGVLLGNKIGWWGLLAITFGGAVYNVYSAAYTGLLGAALSLGLLVTPATLTWCKIRNKDVSHIDNVI